MHDKQIIFIAGVHRSGTSLLHRLLRSHPSISGFENTGKPEDEGQYLQSVLPPDLSAGQFALHPESFIDETHPMATVETAVALYRQWGQHWDLGCDHLIEKTPQNIVKTRFLQQLFPNAAFIVLFRHPIAVAYATKAKSWVKPATIEMLLENTLAAYERVMEDAPLLKKVTMLRYEDFVLDPKSTLDALFHFLRIPPIPPMETASPNLNERYYRMWQKAFLWRWRHRKRLARHEERVRRFGYSFAAPTLTTTTTPRSGPWLQISS